MTMWRLERSKNLVTLQIENLGIKSMDFKVERERMVKEQLIPRGISNPRVLDAFLKVPREKFVPLEFRNLAYFDGPLSIGLGQTISQPFIVALMTELLELSGEEKVLEIGTGSGYQAAILAELSKKVYTIERLSDLTQKAKLVLQDLGYKNVEVVVGDGTGGLAKHSPYEAIIVTAAAPSVPRPLLDQLAEGGRLVIPVGSSFVQELVKITKKEGKVLKEKHGGCRFVPLVGKHGFK